jgi:hypothetical protein
MGRVSGLGLLVAVTLLAFLLAPHAAPALEQGGMGGLLRQAPGLLPRLPRLQPPGRGAAGRPAAAGQAVAYALAQRNKPTGGGTKDRAGSTARGWPGRPGGRPDSSGQG